MLLRAIAPGFFHSAPLSLREEWALLAEQRHIAAAAVTLRLPPDAPPEMVEAATLDKDGKTVAADIHRSAIDSVIAEQYRG